MALIKNLLLHFFMLYGIIGGEVPQNKNYLLDGGPVVVQTSPTR